MHGTFETQGVRVAVEGCGHGTLHAIYDSVARSCQERGWDGVDLLIIGGDFQSCLAEAPVDPTQSVRNASDLTAMSVPVKYRHLGDFPEYYSGARTAPYLTIFIAGNHEASSHLWELYYGGWVAPNIYYLGAANVLRFGPLRIAGMSGIWKGHDYRKPHHERLPFNSDDVKSFYHVREIDVRKLLLIQTQVDVGLSHDWPRAIEKHGDSERLFKKKPDFRSESRDGTLGSVAAEYVMDRLRPPYWFSAHLHVKFAALKKYEDIAGSLGAPAVGEENPAPAQQDAEANPDEIDLDMDGADDDMDAKHQVEQDPGDELKEENTRVSDELRAQLPASFAAPPQRPQTPKRAPGQPVPSGIANKEVRFLALDKCLPKRQYLQLCELVPFDRGQLSLHPPKDSVPRYRLQYDPEWLSITRVFHASLTIGDRNAHVPHDSGEEQYLPLIQAERVWVEENIVKPGKLDVPENFELTAPPHIPGSPEIVQEQPEEYTNSQTTAFCSLLGVENLWDATAEERRERKDRGPAPSAFRGGNRGGFGGGRGGRGGRAYSGSPVMPGRLPYIYEPLPSTSHIRLLKRDGTRQDGRLRFKLVTRHVADDRGLDYHCMSYTWGNPFAHGRFFSEHYESVAPRYEPESMVAIDLDGREIRIPRNLHDALRDVPRSAHMDYLDRPLTGRGGMTYLHEVSEQGHFEIVNGWLWNGAAVDKLDDAGRTALHYAAKSGHATIVGLLCDAGALRSRNDSDDKTAFELARDAGHYEVMSLLETYAGRPDPLPVDSRSPRNPDPADMLIWADAICINQADIEEKSAQVSIMDRIYSNATYVVAWLGPPDEHSSAGLKTIGTLREHLDAFKASQIEPFGGDDKANYTNSAVPYISWPEWAALASIYQRQWFRRAWIVQEAILPRVLLMYLGDRHVSWYDLGSVADALRHSKAKLGASGSTTFGHPDDAAVAVEWNMGEVYKYRTNRNWALRRDVDESEARASRSLFMLSELIFNFWTFLASDPRDKVFALYGVVNAFADRRLMTDYRLSLVDVYTVTTRQLILDVGTLSPLSACVYPVHRRSDLPSWVLDFSLQGINGVPDIFCADKGFEHTSPRTDVADSAALGVRGQRIGTISLAAGRPNIGPAGKLQFDPSWFKLLLSIRPEGGYGDKPILSEILWRTLCMDMSSGSLFNSQVYGTRAPDEFGEQSRMFLLLMILAGADRMILGKLGVEPSTTDNMTVSSLPYNPMEEDMEPTLAALDAISAHDRESNYLPSREEVLYFWDKLECTMVRNTPMDADGGPHDFYVPPEVRQGRTRIVGGGYVVRGSRMFQRCLGFASAYSSVYGGRQLVALNGAFLGMASLSAAAGDEVWILPGLTAPAVLRPTAGLVHGTRPQYEFVGACYIHGLMHGEVAASKGSAVVEIDLV
ncbi:lariat debranching enzyme [Purpureocillium lavendulum]|uniref:Lariat debranching enzyme n=1 Tax=Purpureocillium lavendulum TaxID=1247861 RepID=A0AB34FKT2_9HYPO|nr:lariat debranching enzyme [Purpureocillium lavendulum]